MMLEIGIIHGRFQPFHKGHLEYAMAGKMRCRFLYVGIANPDPSITAEHPANTARAKPSANPFTYWERMLTISRTLVSEGVAPDQFAIVPFPINFPERLQYYVPRCATFFVTVYDDWGRAKRDMLEQSGFSVEVMWERRREDLFTSGTEIRGLMASGRAWKHLVPDATAIAIEELGLDVRLCRTHG